VDIAQANVKPAPINLKINACRSSANGKKKEQED
jgi:hypothetical protein